MRIYSFDPSKGRHVEGFGSSGATISPVTKGPRSWQIVALHLEPDGVLGFHRSVTDQLLLVLQGSGVVATRDTKGKKVAPGAAVYWRANEEHQTRAGPEGIRAIVIEGEGLAKVLAMPLQRR